jgi:hypothetical protein
MDWDTCKPGRDHIPYGTQVKLLLMQIKLKTGSCSRQWKLLILRPLHGEVFERIGIVEHPEPGCKNVHVDAVLEDLYTNTPVEDYFNRKVFTIEESYLAAIVQAYQVCKLLSNNQLRGSQRTTILAADAY